MASIHNRKLIAALARELNQKDLIINKLEERMELLEQAMTSFEIELHDITTVNSAVLEIMTNSQSIRANQAISADVGARTIDNY
jgi:hypothetical protein